MLCEVFFLDRVENIMDKFQILDLSAFFKLTKCLAYSEMGIVRKSKIN